MVTDDERREAAEGLMDEVGCGSSWPGMERLGLILGVEREPRSGWEGRILTRLADLIEPPYPDATATYRGWRAEVYDPDGVLASPSNVAADLVRAHADSKMRHSTKEEQNAYSAMLEKMSVELHPVDRDALLTLADTLGSTGEMDCRGCRLEGAGCAECSSGVAYEAARRIREALGVRE